MMATPSYGDPRPRPGRRRDSGPPAGGGGTGNLDVVFERLDATDRAIAAVTGQVAQIANQVSSLAATTQVLANTDTTFRQQSDAQATQIAANQTRLFDIVQQLGEMKASIKQTITDALREAQQVERRDSDRNTGDTRQIQQYLVSALLAIMAAVLTYLFTHPIH